MMIDDIIVKGNFKRKSTKEPDILYKGQNNATNFTKHKKSDKRYVETILE